MGVKVKMVTGDQIAIAKEMARQLGLGRTSWTPPFLRRASITRLAS